MRATAKTAFAALDTVLPKMKGPRILIYHQVGSGRSHEMNVTVEAFEEQLDWLADNMEIVRLEDGIERWYEPNSDRLAVLTFDDGYADVFENAYPLMMSRRVPFTLYLTTGPIERPASAPAWPGLTLTWQQCNEMIDSGLVTIGSHTHTHPDLRTLTRAMIESELENADNMIREHLGRRPEHFTYPKGWWSEVAHPIVVERYLSATVGTMSVQGFSNGNHCLPRLPVQKSDSRAIFRRKVETGGRTEDWLRLKLRS